MMWAADNMHYDSLRVIVSAPASAELEPTTAEHKQISEEDMGLTFEELGVFGLCLSPTCVLMYS
jgi:NH3-dependent NAD+ synthetase